MKIKIFFLESEEKLTAAQKRLISWLVKKHALIAGQDLKIPLMNFTIYLNKDWCSQQSGGGGYTASAHWIQLFLDRSKPNFKEKVIKNSLLATIYHEMHHAKRMTTVGYGESLLEAVITEGLASVYAEIMFPEFISPWGKYTNKEIKSYLKIFLKNIAKNKKKYDHEEWFLGLGKPHWLGYKVGIYIVRGLKDKCDSFDCTRAVNKKAEEIFEMWRKKFSSL